LTVAIRKHLQNQGSLDLGLADAVLAQRVQPTFDQFVSSAFDDTARA